MKNATFLAIALLFGSAHACERIDVTVLPFEVQTEFSKARAELQAIGSGEEVGLVRAISTVRVDGCSATVGYRDPVLYVARELKRDQCAFDHVLKHEEEHVRIYRAALKTLEARVREAASELTLFEAAKREVLAVQAAHKAHDSDEEYDLNRTACFGKIAKLAAGR
jgi:hypothetical protein